MNITEKLSAASTRNLMIAENVQKVYDAGYESGDYNDGFEAGKKAEYDAFWDAIQDNGKRSYYKYAFSGYSWNEKTFYPKYDIRPTSSVPAMFQEMWVNIDKGYHPFSLTERLKECGVVLDFSQMPSSSGASTVFYASAFTEITNIDFTWATSLDQTFRIARYLETVSFKLNTEGTTKFNLPFAGCSKLVNLTVEGTIGQNGFDVKDSPNLSKASHESIVTHLSTTTSGMSVKFSKTAINKAFETSTEANDGFTNQSSDWYTLIATRQNWTFEYGE